MFLNLPMVESALKRRATNMFTLNDAVPPLLSLQVGPEGEEKG